MIVYLISYGDKAEETVDVVVDVPSGCRSSKKKKNKSKNIVGDESKAMGSAEACEVPGCSQTVLLRFRRRGGGDEKFPEVKSRAEAGSVTDREGFRKQLC
ncbi:hypothetical protein Tco_1144041 [Tanacetum coccineum]